ncbi:protein of unknown function [Trichlorobacter ammonificans]|uniref:Uncharacterized protein n=1 Tax=Trichlorobacter ammonificans TaxID=2916410 RepID=A0ABM9D6G7_9BACT|nr:protein of unknown function [Trichlorobacter ammonificans]
MIYCWRARQVLRRCPALGPETFCGCSGTQNLSSQNPTVGQAAYSAVDMTTTTPFGATARDRTVP